MKILVKSLVLLLLACSFLAPVGQKGMAQNGDGDFVIVVHPSIPGSSITEANLKGIYLRDMRKWGNNNSEIIPVELESEDGVRTAFHSKLFNKTAAQMKAYWVNLRLAKNVPMPATEPDSAAAIKFVAKNSGAIAYVLPSAVDSSVKVLKLVK